MLAEQRPGRDAPARRLEAHRAAAARRDADRAPAVGSMRECAEPCRHRGGRSAARSTRGMREAPWVVRGAEQAVLGGWSGSELGEVGLAQDGAALLFQPRDRKEVHGQRVVLERPRSKRQRIAGERDQVLDRRRHATQRVADVRVVSGFRLLERELRRRQHVRVEPGVELFDARDVRLRELDGRHLAAAHGRRLVKRGREWIHRR